MRDFQSFFLMNTEDVKRYAVEVLHRFEPGEETECREIGDGNINYVFQVRSGRDGRSVIVKQADRLLRSSGRPLDVGRSRIEAAVLKLEGELAPGCVPEVYYYDETMSATAMEDVSHCRNLRRELLAGRTCPHLSETVSSFLADTLLPTTDLVLDAEVKKQRVRFFINPELCSITEDLVLREPYDDYKGRNIITRGNEDFVRTFLYEDEALHAEVGRLRLNFMNNAQALLHGDLHSGSIFVSETELRVLDAEFAFYGPIGYDIGNVIGNLFFPWAYWVFTAPERRDVTAALEKTIEELYDKTAQKFARRYEELVKLPLYRTEAFRQRWLGCVMADAAGYAGTEIIRRTVGDSKVAELENVTDPEKKIPMERALVRLGIALIMEREAFRSGRELTALFRRILEAGGA